MRAPGAGGRPALLAITSQLPWPLDRGGHLRSYHLLRALAGHFQVRLIGGVSEPAAGESVAALRDAGIEAIPVPLAARTLWREALRAAAAALRGEPYVLYRRHARRAMSRVLVDTLRAGRPDVFYLDHLDSLLFAPWCTGAPRVIDLHNVVSALVRRTAAHAPRAGRPYAVYQARLLEHMERRAARTVDLLFGVSDQDVCYFSGLGAQTCLVPNGVDCAAYADLPGGRRSGAPLLLYVGDMSWAPNGVAAAQLARAVLPAVRAQYPDARLRIVGRDPSATVRALAALPGVEVTGAVADVRPHLAAAHLLAVPLAAAGGTRLKILEAFAAGLPVVSTAVGCEGLPVRDGVHLAVASEARFADAVLAVLGDPAGAAERAERARDLVRSDYDWRSVGARACAAVETLLTSRATVQG